MNKDRRNRLTKLQLQLDEVKEEIEMIRDEEEESMNNLPDSLRDGEKGEKMQDVVDELEAAIQNIEDTMSNLTTACDS